MAKSIFVLIHEYCIGKDKPVEGWNELMDFLIRGRSTFVDNNKPVTPVEDREYG